MSFRPDRGLLLLQTRQDVAMSVIGPDTIGSAKWRWLGFLEKALQSWKYSSVDLALCVPMEEASILTHAPDVCGANSTSSAF